MTILAAGCKVPAATVLGAAPTGELQAIGTVKTLPADTPVTVAGEMVQKCPVAGCWFDVRDGTDTIRVDSKNAGFVVLDVPLHTRVTVAGHRSAGTGEPQIDASGLRY